jgi:ABC-type metal ion transport system substrate-binding protein
MYACNKPSNDQGMLSLLITYLLIKIKNSTNDMASLPMGMYSEEIENLVLNGLN